MKFKIAFRLIGEREAVRSDVFEANSILEASHRHGEQWNNHFAFSDRFRSVLYLFETASRRWKRLETINW
jgi:hypothetical protein